MRTVNAAVDQGSSCRPEVGGVQVGERGGLRKVKMGSTREQGLVTRADAPREMGRKYLKNIRSHWA